MSWHESRAALAGRLHAHGGGLRRAAGQSLGPATRGVDWRTTGAHRYRRRVLHAEVLGLVGAGLGVLAVVLAIFVPLAVEWGRRPRLRIERGREVDRDPHWRIVHIHVVDKPLGGLFANFLLRNPATGCHVTMELVSRSGASRVISRGKWSARSEPFAIVPVVAPNIRRSRPRAWRSFVRPRRRRPHAALAQVFDPERLPQTLTLDVSPSTVGEPVAVAIKHDGDAQAYAFDPEIYVFGNLRNPAFALPDKAYDVTVTAHAGEISSKPDQEAHERVEVLIRLRRCARGRFRGVRNPTLICFRLAEPNSRLEVADLMTR